jgi:phosphatidylserine/phosphatidylglycerophosphate/cardiolipin synthase-like enzyme
MPRFVSPLADLAGWTLTAVPEVELPARLRYGGHVCRGLRAERAAPADVLMPAPGVLRRIAVSGGPTVIEIQVNPFRMQDVVGAITFGLPTFYLFFDAATPFAFSDGDIDAEGAALATVNRVTLVQIGQDRIVRDPAEWARAIAAAIPNPETGPTSWQAFATAVDVALNSPVTRAILILDHRGQLAKTAPLRLVFDQTPSVDVDLTEVDSGDLRAALRRLGLPDDPFADGGPAILRHRGGDPQLVRIEDRVTGTGEIGLATTGRHIQFTDLERWFAPQFAIPENETVSPLRRYTRGNRLTPFVNGRQLYRAFFDKLLRIDGQRQGVHLTGGFSLDAEADLLELEPSDDPDRPTSVKAALDRIKDNFPELADGGGRFLSAKFIQIEPNETLSQKEIAAFYFLVGVIGVANLAKLGLGGLKADGSGFAILVLIALLHHNLINEFVEANGEPLEFMRDAVRLLDDPALSSINKFSPLPTTIADNPLAPSGFPFDTLFPFIRHFGLYHQKIAVIRNGDGAFGFCGGIDMNPNRVDDADHNVVGPYHDVHAMVEGEAVIDVATTFEQRWARDGVDDDGAALPTAFSVTDIAPVPMAGEDIVQVARTYPLVLDPSTRLAFAPFGDRTIRDTTLKAIAAAKEYIHIEDQYFTPPPHYVDAIVERVASGELRKLIITLPTSSDQPYGEISQTQSIAAFRAAEADAGATPGEIVKIGILRRHFTVASNTLRAASGKLILGDEMIAQPADPGFDDTIVLRPKARVPPPPFWIAVDGELMWVYDEASVLVHGEPPEGTGRYLVDRGQRTRLFGLGTGARPRNHSEGAAATVIDLKGIFVHAKVILIDDVFAGIGSANVNRRGFYSDGEGHFFWMPERLKVKAPGAAPGGHNPIARLRHEIWAELLNLPYPMAAPLLEDPIAAAALFDRMPIHGNRFTPRDAIPLNLSFGALNGGDSIIASVLQALFTTIVSLNHQAIFDGVVDPTTQLEPLA